MLRVSSDMSSCLVRTQNFLKNCSISPPDAHTYVCVSGGKKYCFFRKFCVVTKWMIPMKVLANQYWSMLLRTQFSSHHFYKNIFKKAWIIQRINKCNHNQKLRYNEHRELLQLQQVILIINITMSVWNIWLY